MPKGHLYFRINVINMHALSVFPIALCFQIEALSTLSLTSSNVEKQTKMVYMLLFFQCLHLFHAQGAVLCIPSHFL